MKSLASALAVAALLVGSASAQCNPQPRLDQTNLNLGSLLSQGATAFAQPGCTSCQQGAGASSATAVAGVPAPSNDLQNLQAQVAALQAQIASQSFQTNAYKPLRVASSASAAASASAGDMYAAPAPAPAPAPVQPLAFPVALALPANSASASATTSTASNSCSSGSCGRRGFFRRANRTRTRAVTVANGSRSVSSSASVSR